MTDPAMNDRVDAMFADGLLDQGLVADIADHQLGLISHGPVETGRKPIQHHDLFAMAK